MPKDIALVIPAYRPTSRLVELVRDLKVLPDCLIIIIDDGSGAEYRPVFDALQDESIVVLRNAINLGKGAALKHAINHALVSFPALTGIVTADADGQHAAHDIKRVADELATYPSNFVLGSREFGSDIPFRSKFGNNISRIVYRALLGLTLQDTQTGLRGIPVKLAKACLSIRANRYEFETEMLTVAASMKVPIREIGIQTIYEDHNASSHFNPLLDSARIYFVVLRYAFSSLATAAVDFIVFLALLPLLPNLVVTNLASRAFALGVQFFLLRSFVFKSGGGVGKLAMFVLYVMVTGLASGILQTALIDATAIGAMSAKVVVEATIFVFNFLFLREFLFRRAT